MTIAIAQPSFADGGRFSIVEQSFLYQQFRLISGLDSVTGAMSETVVFVSS
jgi:hypothetical protein